MRRRNALTLIESLVVIAIVGLAVAFGVRAIGPDAASDARRLATSLNRLRAVAATSGTSVAIIGNPCLADRPVSGAVALSDSVITWPPRGLLFTPDGLPRTCDGGGVGNTTILLEHRGRQAAVIVSSLGRVRWEMR